MPSPIVRRLAFLLLAAFTVLWIAHHHTSVDVTYYLRPKFTWQKAPFHNAEPALIDLPWLSSAPAPDIPAIQASFPAESDKARALRLSRRDAVKAAFLHTWTGYKERAWLHDELLPLSGGHADPFGGWAATLVDSLDTLWIMEEWDLFDEAAQAVHHIDFGRCSLETLSTFETTIRFLGGLLSAWDLCCVDAGASDHDDLAARRARYAVLLDKALQVGELLYRAFDTPNNMPIARFNWRLGRAGSAQLQGTSMALAELGSLTLEFTRLSQLTSSPKFFSAAQAISDVLRDAQNTTRLPGLWPLVVDPRSLDFGSDNAFTMGGMVDSVYEYLPKMALLVHARLPMYGDMWRTAAAAAKAFLIFEPQHPPLADLAPLILGSVDAFGPREADDSEEHKRTFAFRAEGQHLTCFAAATFALGARILGAAEDAQVATRLADGCVWSYLASPSGLGPEIFKATPCRRGRAAVSRGKEADFEGRRGECAWLATDPSDTGITVSDSRYLLRPEAIEAVFTLHRTTAAPKWAELGWQMFRAIERNCRTEYGYAAVDRVQEPSPRLLDSAESFWTGETLKYFYLLYSEPGLVSLDEWVLNTEAHPFRWRVAAG